MVGAFVEPHTVLKTSELIRLILLGILLMDGGFSGTTDHSKIEKIDSIQFNLVFWIVS